LWLFFCASQDWQQKNKAKKNFVKFASHKLYLKLMIFIFELDANYFYHDKK
jgi:hypothetical protein